MYNPLFDFEGVDFKNKNWVDLAKTNKEFFVSNTERGDLPPTIIGERNGEVFAIVIAPQVDKKFAHQASYMLHHGAGADAIVLILDAHCRSFDANDENAKEFLENYKNGDMQRTREEKGDYESSISDCLICYRIDDKGVISGTILPYSCIDGNLKWGDETKYKDAELSGSLCQAIQDIMNKESIINDLLKVGREVGFSEEKIVYHSARAAFQVLLDSKFYLFDMLSCRHPEWCDAAKKAEKIVLLLAKNGRLPKAIVPVLANIIPENIGKPSFKNEVAKIIVKYKDRFSEEFKDIPEHAEIFANWLHQESFSPFIDNQPSSENGKPCRVKVWNGDRSEFLGEGVYVGNVTVYFVNTENGIVSASNAEEKPEGIPEEQIIETPNNPKIVLDDGRVVYGCQVWWEIIKDSSNNQTKDSSNYQKWLGPKNKA